MGVRVSDLFQATVLGRGVVVDVDDLICYNVKNCWNERETGHRPFGFVTDECPLFRLDYMTNIRLALR